MAGIQSCCSWNWKVIGLALVVPPSTAACVVAGSGLWVNPTRTPATMPATARVANRVSALMARVLVRGTSCSSSAAPSGTISTRVSQGTWFTGALRSSPARHEDHQRHEGADEEQHAGGVVADQARLH